MLLSIITINRNNLEGLQRTIQSIVSQTWKDFEWIVIDGASTDGSREYIEQFSSCFSFWISEADSGIYSAMNKGIAHSHGDYCLFLNSGDWLTNPEALLYFVQLGVHADIVSLDSYIDSGDRTYQLCKLDSEPMTALFWMQATISHQSAFIRRRLFELYGCYDESLQIVSDWKFFLEAIVFHEVSFIHYSYKFAYIQPDGVSSTKESERIDERSRVIKSLFPSMVIADYQKVKSLSYVQRSSVLCRRMYGVLYRLADLIHRFKGF